MPRDSQYKLILEHLLAGKTITDDFARSSEFHKCCRLADVIWKIRNRTKYDVVTEMIPNLSGGEHARYHIRFCPECETFIPRYQSLCQCKKAEVLL